MLSKISTSFIKLCLIHKGIDCFYKTKNINTLVCTISQLYFILKSLYIILYDFLNYSPKNLLIYKTLNNIQFIIGYFFYDSLYILLVSRNYLFLGHHIIAIIFCHLIQKIGIQKDLIIPYNILSFVLEVINPFLNIRHNLKGTKYESFNRYMIVFTYTIFRIILYPIIYLKGMKILDERDMLTPFVKNVLYWKFYIIYIMSILWYRKILKFIGINLIHNKIE